MLFHNSSLCLRTRKVIVMILTSLFPWYAFIHQKISYINVCDSSSKRVQMMLVATIFGVSERSLVIGSTTTFHPLYPSPPNHVQVVVCRMILQVAFCVRWNTNGMMKSVHYFAHNFQLLMLAFFQNPLRHTCRIVEDFR